MAYTTPRTWSAGEIVTASIMNTHLRDNLNAAFPLGVDAWTAWTPTLTNATLGNGTVTAAYQRAPGRTIHYRFKFTLGSTSTVGTAVAFSLPVDVGGGWSTGDPMGDGRLTDATGADFRAQVWRSGTAGTATIVYVAATANYGDLTATLPFTWATSDIMFVSGTYEAAS